MRPTHAVPAVLLAAAALAGCGGGGESSSDTSGAVTPASTQQQPLATTTQTTPPRTTTTAPKTTTTAPKKAANGPDGAKIFATVGCAGCHTLSAAGSNGNVGPNLDELQPSFEAVQAQVTNGGGGMPAFGGQLSSAQIDAVARYVSENAGK